MNYVDFIILAIVFVGFVLGYKDGLVRKIIGLIGFVLAVGFAFEFSDKLGFILVPVFNDDSYLANLIAGIIIFFVTILFFSILKRVIHPVDKVNRFVNKFLGGISGGVQILFFISGFLLFLNIFGIPSEKTRKESLFYEKTFNIIPWSIDFIMGANSKVHNFIEDYINNPGELPLPDLPDSTSTDTLNTEI